MQDVKKLPVQIANAMQPNLEYFVDPNQNFISDFFGALTQAGTSIGSVSGGQSCVNQLFTLHVECWAPYVGFGEVKRALVQYHMNLQGNRAATSCGVEMQAFVHWTPQQGPLP